MNSINYKRPGYLYINKEDLRHFNPLIVDGYILTNGRMCVDNSEVMILYLTPCNDQKNLYMKLEATVFKIIKMHEISCSYIYIDIVKEHDGFIRELGFINGLVVQEVVSKIVKHRDVMDIKRSGSLDKVQKEIDNITDMLSDNSYLESYYKHTEEEINKVKATIDNSDININIYKNRCWSN